MHTVMVILGGFIIYGLLIGLCHLLGYPDYIPLASKWFLPIWLVAAFINMAVGVLHANYTWLEELPIFIIIYMVPACVAFYVWKKYSV